MFTWPADCMYAHLRFGALVCGEVFFRGSGPPELWERQRSARPAPRLMLYKGARPNCL